MTEHAPWTGKQGTRRIMAEFKYLNDQILAGKNAQVSDLQLVKDDMHKWRFKLRGFDDDTPGGKQLNLDLNELRRNHGMDHILMEASFPQDYPHQPFLLRVVKPRCMWYTGHVTAGGSICIESLTLSGTPGSWQSTYCVEAILTAVTTNMIDCEKVMIRTATGPGGESGPLRIDLRSVFAPTMSEYSEGEARAAFQRQMHHHSVHGWGGGDGGGEGSGSQAAGSRGAGPSSRRSKLPAPTDLARAAAGSSSLPPAVPARALKRSLRLGSDNVGVGADGDGPVAATDKRRRHPAPPPAKTAAAPAPAAAPAAPAAARGVTIDLTDMDDGDEAAPPLPARPPRRQQQQAGGSSEQPSRSKGEAKAQGSGHRAQTRSSRGGDSDDEVLVVGWVFPEDSAARGQGGALPAAVQAASRKPLVDLLGPDDPAAAELEALRTKYEALQQALEKEKEKASSASGLRAPLPSHWQPMDPQRDHEVKFVALPLPDHPGQAAQEPGEDDVDEQALQEMVFNGVPKEDAVAALLHADNDPEAAYAFHLHSMHRGGAAAALRRKKASDPEASARQAEARHTALVAEARQVSDLWYQEMAATPNCRIMKIERVQNWRLWTKFCLRSKEVQDATGKKQHEHQLWHGSPTLDNISAIVMGGFDHRLSNLGGSLGAGTYFAKDASYSHGYSARNGLASGMMPGMPVMPPGMAGLPGMAALMSNAAGWAQTLSKITLAAGGSSGPSRAPRGKAAKKATKAAVRAGGHEYAGNFAMMLCRVALGRIGRGGPSLRLPPKNCDSVSASGTPQPVKGDIFAIFDNAQAYPEYIIHYN